MNNKEFRCNCVEMTRAIKDKIDAKFARMNGDEIVEYLRKTHLEFNKSRPPRNTLNVDGSDILLRSN
jgi:hypothetical protein